MPNGRPGDHPYTDIVTHKIETFSRRADDLIRELAVIVPGQALWEMISCLYREHDLIRIARSGSCTLFYCKITTF